MPKITLEAAALIGVVAAVIAGSFYALGTVAHLSYFNALGFDAHQFPELGSELHVTGFVYGALPALVAGLVALVLACSFELSNRAENWLSRAPAKWRIPVGLILIAVAVGAAYFSPPATPKQWVLPLFIVGTVFAGTFLLGKWVSPVVMCFFLGIFMFLLAIGHVSNQAYAAGKARAEQAGKNPATTIIDFVDDRSPITAPGDRITCSERFCGFHDGKTATVISLEDVRSIQSPEPPEQPPPPAAERRGFWGRLFGR